MSFLEKLQQKQNQANMDATTVVNLDPRLVELNRDPYVGIIDDFFTPAECQSLIDYASEDLQQAQVITNGIVREDYIKRTCKNRGITRTIPEFANLMSRVSGLIGLNIDYVEPPDCIRYMPGEEFRPHWDAQFCRYLNYHIYGCNRIFTALAYLNTVGEESGTHFPRLDLTIEPRQGRIVLFQDCQEEDVLTPHELSSHTGLPAQEEKWVCTFWMDHTPERKFYKLTQTPKLQINHPSAG